MPTDQRQQGGRRESDPLSAAEIEAAWDAQAPIAETHMLCVGCATEVHHCCGACGSPVCWTCSTRFVCCEGNEASTWNRPTVPRSPEESRRRAQS